MKNYIQPGDTVTVTAPANVASGEGVLIGKLFGVAAISAASGQDVEIKTTGVYELPKTSAQEWATVGLPIYWDDSTGVLTTVAASNTFVGVNLAAAANPSGYGVVRLNGTFGSPSGAQVTAEIAG
jgi:predicted RecA/RadA family phage recombinase